MGPVGSAHLIDKALVVTVQRFVAAHQLVDSCIPHHRGPQLCVHHHRAQDLDGDIVGPTLHGVKGWGREVMRTYCNYFTPSGLISWGVCDLCVGGKYTRSMHTCLYK